jgi:hypothetical protein
MHEELAALPHLPGLIILRIDELTRLAKANRPLTKWLKVTLHCYDVSGKALWEETASDGGGLTAANAPQHVQKQLEKSLAERIGKEGLPLKVKPGDAK